MKKIIFIMLVIFSSYCVGGELIFQQVPESFTVQTSLSEWLRFPAFILTPDAGLNRDGEDDISATVVPGWNSRSLFVVVRVKDDIFSANDVFNCFWNGDSIQLAFDPLNNTGAKRFDDDDISLGAADFPLGKRVLGMHVPSGSKRGIWKGIPFEVRHTESETIYLLGLPWGYLGQLDPLSDTPFKFNLIVNENDGGRRLGWLELSDGIGEGLNISKFRLARFGRIDNYGSQIHIITDRQQYDLSDSVLVKVSSRNIAAGATVKVQIGQTVEERVVSGGKSSAELFKFAKLEWHTGVVPINVILTDKAGQVIARAKRDVLVSNKLEKQKVVREVSDTLSQIKTILSALRTRGSEVDYLQLRFNCIEQGLRMAALGEGSYRQKDGTMFTPRDIYENAVTYLKAATPKLLADAESALEDHDYQGFVIPNPDIQQLWQIRDGNIYVDDMPITLNGWIWANDKKDKNYAGKDFALNSGALNPGPRMFMPNSWKYEDTGSFGWLIDTYQKWLTDGVIQNETFDILLSPHYQPGWFLKLKTMDNAYTKWHRFNGWWINTYDGRKLLVRFYAAAAAKYGSMSSLKTADLANEWVFYDATPAAVEKFRQWLSKRHVSIDVLNNRWGTHFMSFDDIPSPNPAGKLLDSHNPLVPEGIYRKRGPYWDWCCFNCEHAATTVSWMNKTVKRYFPNILTHIKIIFSSWAYRDMAKNFLLGNDPQLIMPITDLMGTDASLVSGNSWKETLFVYDYLKSICPEKPIYLSEWHAYPYNGIGAQVMRRGKFQYFIHGERLSLLFFNVTTALPALFGKDGNHPQMIINRSPAALEAFAVTAADLRRLASEIGQFSKRKPSLLIFYDNAADFAAPDNKELAGRYGYRAIRIHSSLLSWDVKVGIVTEKMLAKSVPEQPLIILAGAQYVSDETVEKLKQFIANGGRLVWLKDNLQFDHYGHRRSSEELAIFTESEQVIHVRATGDFAQLWSKLLTAANVDCPFIIKKKSGQVPASVEILSAVDENNKPLIFLANTKPEPISFQLYGKIPDNMKFIDLVSGKPVDSKLVSLQGNQVMLLCSD